MLVEPNPNRRCVIWFGTPTEKERQLLAAHGWSLRTVEAGAATVAGMRIGDVVVGLFDLRRDFVAYLDQVEAWLQQQAANALLGLVSVSTPDAEPRINQVLDACTHVFKMPLDTSDFATVLNAAAYSSTPTIAPPSEALDELIGESEPMLAIRASMRRFGPIDLPVLITGDTGTGKEVAARALHGLSSRGKHPFAAINCGALPAALVQSELFGHERGAFTGATTRRAGLFEAANGGTVFLDEIGDLPLEAQTNLLRVLQEGNVERVGSHQSVKVDVRVLAATHVDLEHAVAQGRFREDLYYRLNVLRLRMPALRERGDDIERLAENFLARFREQHKVRPHGFSAGARSALRRFDWPGNVRELLNRVQRAAITGDAPLLEAQDLDLPAADDEATPILANARSLAERETLMSALHDTDWNISACARRMCVSRVTVYRLCRKHQVALDGTR